MVTFRASVNPTQTQSSLVDFITCLLNSVTTAHMLHLQTTSFSQHMALGTYYNEIGDLVDSFVEAYQGKYGLVTGYPATAALMSNMMPLEYVEYLKEEVQSLRVKQDFPQDSELQNITDEIAQLIDSTLYKLRFLK